MWVPGNPLAKRAGINEDPQQPRTYLKNELGDRYDVSRVDAFLDNGPRMVAFFEEHTELQFVDGNGKVPAARRRLALRRGALDEAVARADEILLADAPPFDTLQATLIAAEALTAAGRLDEAERRLATAADALDWSKSRH